MHATADKLVEDYLDDLEKALADVPRARRRELVAEIAGHIAEVAAFAVPAARQPDRADRRLARGRRHVAGVERVDDA